jgi:hypothetical protein
LRSSPESTAIPISAGGLGGAGGAIIMIIMGDDRQVTRAIDYVQEVKGVQLLREVWVADRMDYGMELCSLRGAISLSAKV